MRRLSATFLLAAIAAPGAFSAPDATPRVVSSAGPFVGTFSQDTDQREVFFTLQQAGEVVLRTFSYAGGVTSGGTIIPRGGFDPTLSVFDSSGRLVASNEDGGCGAVAADAVTGLCWDSYLGLVLPAGNYRLVLTQSTNTANGPTLGDSFKYACSAANQNAGICSQNFTPDPNPGVLEAGFWDESRNQRLGSYAVDILGATSATAPSISSSPDLPPGTVGQTYPAFTFNVQPTGAYQWSVAQGTLPPGITLNPNTGVLTGTPLSAGTYIFTVQASDGIQPLQQAVSLTTFNAASPLSISVVLPPAIVGQFYGPVVVLASGGSGSYSYSAVNLPANLTLSQTGGVISGLPGSVGTFTGIVVTVTDLMSGLTASSGGLSLTILASSGTVLSVTSSGTSGEIPLGSSVSTKFSVTGGTAPYTFSALNLATGLTLDPATGQLTGTPQQPGSYSFTIVVTDSQTPANTANYPFSLQVFGLGPVTLPKATTGSVYSQTFSPAGGKAPFVFSSSNLPPGLSLSGALLSGTPATPGTYSFTVQVTDANGVSSSFAVTLVVSAASSLSVSGGPLPGGAVSAPYSQTLGVTGGTGPYIWSIVSGAVPDGLSLASNGALTGTPSKAGTFSFTAQAADNSGVTATATFTITIAAQPLVLSGLPVPNGIAGAAYPLQILTATGGTAPYTFSYTGMLPPGMTFSNGQLTGTPTSNGTFSISVTLADSAVPPMTVTQAAQILVNPSGPDLILSTASVSFALTVAASGLPAPQNVTIRSSDVQQLLNYSVVPTPAVGWLQVTGAGTGTTTPGSLTLTLDPSATSLPASATPLTTTIVITCVAPSPCAGKAQTVHVSLSVSSPAAQLVFTSSLVEFSTAASNPASLTLPVGLQNIGSGAATITSVTAADSWLTVSGSPATVPGGPAVLLSFTANPAGLGTGLSRTTVTANSPNGSVSVPVTFFIPPAATLLLSTKGAQFPSNAGSSPGDNHGSFQLSIAGGGTVGWTATVQAGAPWLSLNASSASGSVGPATPATISYNIDRTAASALSPAGSYYGTIQVASAGAANSPQSFQVVLNVDPSASLPLPDPQPGGLIFTSTLGSVASASQTVTVYSSSPSPIPYSAAATTLSGGSWLTLTPAVGNSSISTPGVSAIAVNPGTLAAGVYFGAVSYQFSAAAVRTVNVTLIVEQQGSSSAPLESNVTADAGAACTSKQLVPSQTGLVSNFAQGAGLPTPLAIRVLTDCGTPVANAQVIARFSNGDPPLQLALADAGSGLYEGTWTPRSTSPQVTIATTVTAAGFSAVTTSITGLVLPTGVPLLAPGAVVHIYNPLLGGAVAPGTILAIYGSNLAPQAATDSGAPLPAVLAGTSVTIGGISAPLYYVSPSQIDAQLPSELLAGNQYEVIINSSGALSTPGSISVSAAIPGIAAFPNGVVIAQHADYSLVSPASPAKPGEYLVLYLAGLGVTDSAVADGAASPASPLAHPLIAPILSLNGTNVPVYFGGLTPGFVGLYQINFQVPVNIPSGDIQLVVSQAGVASNSTILPVQN